MFSKLDLSHSVIVRPNGTKRVQQMFLLPSKTDQSFKKDCDINLMIKRFVKQNRMSNFQFLSYMDKYCPKFSDGVIDAEVPDYQFHLQAQVDAQNMFMSLPSSLRKRFDNDPGNFLSFASDPNNRASMADLGLLTPDATAALKAAQKPQASSTGDVSSSDISANSST